MDENRYPNDSVQYEDAITSYLSFTNTTNIGAARAALESADWNLEAAVEAYFDSTSQVNSHLHTDSAVVSNSTYKPLSVDDSNVFEGNGPHSSSSSRTRNHQRAYEAARPRRPTPKFLSFLFRLWIGPLRFLAVPISFVADIGMTAFGVLGRLLGVRLPSISFHWPRPSSFGWSQPSTVDPRIAAERWVRELEEELNARSSYTSAQPGDSDMPRLPEFLLMGYDDAIKKAKEELKVLMVVLVSSEHDDTAHFKRTTLMDEKLLEVLRKKDILVWGGDVRDRDASFAGQILDATAYPFVAFVSLQAKRPASTSQILNSRPSSYLMTVCTRLEGSPFDATCSNSIINAIDSIVLPRVSAHLNRMKKEKARREADRKLREEQDRAYAEAGRLDRERVMKKKAEIEAESRKLAELRQKELENERKRMQKLDMEEQRRRWRYWAKKERMGKEPAEGVKVVFRLGNGTRVIRKFDPNDSIESLYLFVEIESGGKVEMQEDLPRPEPSYVHSYSFKLSTAIPRRIIPEGGISIDEFGGLNGTNVNVEGGCFQDSSSSSEDEGDEVENDSEA